MKCKSLLSFSFIALTFSAGAQNSPTFAITGTGNGDFQWSNIRQVNAETGKMIKDVYINNKTAFSLLNAASKAPVLQQTFKYNINGVSNVYQMQDAPTLTMVAAAAYDKRHDKLFFTPMRIGELRWLDLSTSNESPKFYTEKVQLLNNGDLLDEANHITRMDIAADGNGYAISNDGNHFIRFSTGKNISITDLGNLIDAESNSGGISIHNRCTSWGGDMVADAFGKLYIISASHQVFKVDIDSRIATHIGTITGLPATFTTNGAAVDADGKIVVSCATSFEGLYKFDIKDFVASKVEGADAGYNASDLANGNLLFQKEADAQRALSTVALPAAVPVNTDARIYPNPVTANEFKIQFDGQKAGKYMVTVTDLAGRAVLNKSIIISTKVQAETVQITNTIGKGMYLVKVTDTNNQVVFTDRLMVQ
ncbi:MAG: T9SS type A sorting domain-containing protein [Ferruginibacter sp.]